MDKIISMLPLNGFEFLIAFPIIFVFLFIMDDDKDKDIKEDEDVY